MTNKEVVHTSDITIRVGLNSDKVPVRIEWATSDMHSAGQMEACKAMAIALFDEAHKDTLRIDLWTQDLQVIEMDRFMFQTLRSLSETYLKATQNRELAEQMAQFAQYFGEKTEIIPKEKG
jgi:gliding motility-associated protein GldC